ncbi:MAG: hypothetical protein PHF14_14380 [Verrucomicrobiota bacterium]|nr:hypothetical protein [Verrucomicrobiota bacterium]
MISVISVAGIDSDSDPDPDPDSGNHCLEATHEGACLLDSL